MTDAADITAIIYARVSDRKQSERDVSVPTQIEIGKRDAEKLGARVIKIFRDDARSAFKEANRPAFEAAIDMAVTMEVTYFLCWDSARFARNKYEAMLNKRALDRANVELRYLSTPIDRKNDVGWAMDGMMEIFNELTSRRISADTRRSIMRNARMGYFCGGHTPFGFRVVPAPDNPKRKKLVPNEEEADQALEIFRMRVTGRGAYLIAKELNSHGRLRRGTKWTKQTVLYELRNEAMVGRTIFNRRDRHRGIRPRENWIIIESHEGIIPADLFERVQGMLDDAADTAKGSPKSHHAFTGILHCGSCGSTLQIETSRGRGGLYFYYRCRRAMQAGGCDDGRRLRADHIDAWLSDVILDRVLTKKNLAELADLVEREASTWAKEQRRRRSRIVTQAKQLQEANSRLFEVLELYGRDAPNLGDLTRRLRQNNIKIKAAEEQLAALDAEQPPAGSLTAEDLDELGEFLRSMIKAETNAMRARAFYSGFVDSIVVGQEELTINYSPERLLNPQPQRVRSKRNWRPVLASLRTISITVPLAEHFWARHRGRPRVTPFRADGSGSA